MGYATLPVTDAQGRVAGMVSERDLLRCRACRSTGSAARCARAADEATLALLARDIGCLTRRLLGRASARQLTELISHLNDLLTTRLIELCRDASRRRSGTRLLARLRLRGPRRADHRHRPGTTASSSTSDEPERDRRPGWPSRATSTPGSTPAAFRCARARSWRATPNAACRSANGLQRHWIDHGAPKTCSPRRFIRPAPLAGDAHAGCAAQRDHAPGRRRAALHQAAGAEPLRNRAPLDWKDAGRRRREVDGRAQYSTSR